MGRAEEIRNESDNELKNMLDVLKREIFELRSQALDSKTQQTHLLTVKRRDIARVLTILKERELKGQNVKV